MKKFLLFLFLLPCVSAGLVFEPSSLNLDGIVDTDIPFSVNVSNENNFSVFDVEFVDSSGFFVFDNSIGVLGQGESGVLSGFLNADFLGEKSFDLVIRYNILTGDVVGDQEVFVLLSRDSFVPQFVNVSEGSTVFWNNTDSVVHNIRSDGLFDLTLLPNESGSFVFDSQGSFVIEDVLFGFGGVVDVFNESVSVKTHDSGLDQVLSVSSVVANAQTVVEAQIIEGEAFNLSRGSSGQGLVKVANTGSDKALGVVLGSDSGWVVFDNNNFVVDAGQNSFVPFTVTPSILESGETNKSYNFSISVRGVNFEEKNLPFSVFVPYEQVVFTNNTSSEELIVIIQDLLEKVKQLNETGNNQSFQQGQGLIEVNFTRDEWDAQVSSIATILTMLSGIEKKVDDVTLKANSLEGVFNSQNESLTGLSQNYDRIEEEGLATTVSVWGVITIFYIVGFLFFIYHLSKKKQKKKEGFGLSTGRNL